jgi:hypothetical protein
MQDMFNESTSVLQPLSHGQTMNATSVYTFKCMVVCQNVIIHITIFHAVMTSYDFALL